MGTDDDFPPHLLDVLGPQCVKAGGYPRVRTVTAEHGIRPRLHNPPEFPHRRQRGVTAVAAPPVIRIRLLQGMLVKEVGELDELEGERLDRGRCGADDSPGRRRALQFLEQRRRGLRETVETEGKDGLLYERRESPSHGVTAELKKSVGNHLHHQGLPVGQQEGEEGCDNCRLAPPP